MAFVSRLVLGPDRKLRMLWRAVIFLVLANWGVPFLLDPAFSFAASRLRWPGGLTAAAVALNELENFIVALVCAAYVALYEHRRVDSYGLPVAQALGARTAEGALAGVVMAGAVAAGMWLLGGMQIRGFATTGSTLALAALAWLGANVAVGVAEEFWFRSYLLQSLWKSIGFWPASIVIALLFAADHYFFKTGENVWDVITLVSLSLLMCYSVLRVDLFQCRHGFAHVLLLVWRQVQAAHHRVNRLYAGNLQRAFHRVHDPAVAARSEHDQAAALDVEAHRQLMLEIVGDDADGTFVRGEFVREAADPVLDPDGHAGRREHLLERSDRNVTGGESVTGDDCGNLREHHLHLGVGQRLAIQRAEVLRLADRPL